jgi:hypothetical protein
MTAPDHPEPERLDALVIGAGPAGLMAAEVLACAGRRVTVAEAKPSPGRKFLMAGKSGLNLTKDEPAPAFASAYGDGAGPLAPMLAALGPDAVMDWARGLGQPVFTGSTGRVFPVAMKASPLLRAWLARLDGLGVALRTRWRWTGWADGRLAFDTPDGPRTLAPRVTVLALGGGSWARLGSDGAWTAHLAARGVPVSPFAASNVGLSVAWSAAMTPHLGQPVKAIALSAGPTRSRGEVVLTAKGIEGGGLYPLAPMIRAGHPLVLDLTPDLGPDEVARRLSAPRGKRTVAEHLRRTLHLPDVKRALLTEVARPLPADPAALAALVKALPVPHQGPRPLDEAISTAGGLPFAALTEALELRALPGVFACGEMLDWDAPTGGYLLTACLATGAWAGRHAAAHAAAVIP